MKILVPFLSGCLAAASCSRKPPAATSDRSGEGGPPSSLLASAAQDRENAQLAIEGIRVAKKGGRKLPRVASGGESGPSRAVTAEGEGAGDLKGRIEGWMISDQVIDFSNESLHAAECLANASQIISACRLFATDHGGNYPLVLSDLVPQYLRDPSVFGASRFPNSNEIGYEYFGGKVTDPSSAVLLRGCYTTTDGKRTVFRVDGSGTRERP